MDGWMDGDQIVHPSLVSLAAWEVFRDARRDFFFCLEFIQTSPHNLSDPPLVFLRIIPAHHTRVHVRRAVEIRITQHGDDTHENALHTQDRSPLLTDVFLLIEFVLLRFVQDGNAHATIRIH